MKLQLALSLLLIASSAVAGDLSMYCGKGTVDQMDEFVDSGLVRDESAYARFDDGVISYSVIYSDGEYTFIKSNRNIGGVEFFQSSASGDFSQSELVDGFSCHIND